MEWVIIKCEVAAARLGIDLTPLSRSLNLMASELACWTEANVAWARLWTSMCFRSLDKDTSSCFVRSSRFAMSAFVVVKA